MFDVKHVLLCALCATVYSATVCFVRHCEQYYCVLYLVLPECDVRDHKEEVKRKKYSIKAVFYDMSCRYFMCCKTDLLLFYKLEQQALTCVLLVVYLNWQSMA